jgi:tripartite ATP-independent transporter DctM subunit
MSVEAPLASEFIPAPREEISGWRRWARESENALVALALGVMVLLPLTEATLRKLFHTGISGAGEILQHFTLILGILGGALAAREARLLSFSTFTNFLKPRWRTWAHIFSHGFAAMLAAFLCIASTQLVLSEKEIGNILVYRIPVWVVELILPIGFGVIALRLVWHAAKNWKGRLTALLLAGALLGFAIYQHNTAHKPVGLALLALLVATLLGAPVFATLGGAALILFWGQDLPIASIPLTHYSLLKNPTLATIPLFTLAGYFLAEGGASKRLVRVFNAFVGQFRGGPAVVTALACAFFTSFTGASGVTILALGGVLMPVLLAAKYSDRAALGLLTGAGSLGMLFPPCLPLILYAVVANANAATAGVTIEKMFLGGIGPGILLVALTAWWGIRQSPKVAAAARRFDAREAGHALWEAKWELLLPVVALVSMFSGWATPVEASAVTAFYAFFIQTVIHRDLKPGDLPRVMAECGLLVGGVLLILGVAMGFTNCMIDAQIPDRMVAWSTSAIKSKWLFLLCLNLVLLFVGGLIEIYAAIIVVVPLLVPIGLAFGLDPIHLGIIFLANMELGFLAPPVGLNLLLASYRFDKPIVEVMRAVLPILIVLFIGVLLITYFPPLTTLLPQLLE